MHRQEAKFLLSAYRPNGADALDPDLAEARRFAQRDPELARWFAAQLKFDAAIAQRLGELFPTAEMRAEIYAGISLQLKGQSRRAGWRFSGAAIAATVVVLAGMDVAGLHSNNFMNQIFLYTLAMTGFGVGFLHAVIPTHWLPFVAIGRARNWSNRRILAAVALAGGGHILATTALGIGLAWFGFRLNERFDQAFHWVAGAILVGLGVWLAFRASHGPGCDHYQGNLEKKRAAASDRAAMWGLLLTLTLSPCELFLPIYLTAAPYGWTGVAWLSAVLAVATLGGMLTLTWVTLHAVQRLQWRPLQHLDSRLTGVLLLLLGVATVAFGH